MHWITLASNDSEIRGTPQNPGKSQVLTRGDLDVICQDDSWLTDALINYGVEEFDGLGPALTDLANNVLWIRPSLVKLGKAGDAEAFHASIGGALGIVRQNIVAIDAPQPPFRNANVILFPVNKDDTHWSLLAFYKGVSSDTCEFVHYDSLQPANDAAATALIQKLRTENILSRDFVFTTQQNLPRQEDGFNCGVFVIQYARKIMALGRKPSGEELRAITSQTCTELRNGMRIALSPLIAQAPPVLDYWWEHPSSENDGPVGSQPAKTEEERKEALKQIHEQLKKDVEKPVELISVAKCEKAHPSTIVAVITSKTPDIQDIDGGNVTFTVNGQQFTRPVSFDGKRWLTSIKLQVPERVKMAISATAIPRKEFTEETKSEAEFNVDPGTEKEYIFEFVPKDPRRLFLKFVVEDPEENKNKQENEKIYRPFPKDFVVEFVFDNGIETATGVVQADGSINDKKDNKAGIRVKNRFNRLVPEFPDTGKRQCVAWKPSDQPNQGTQLVAEDTKNSPQLRVGFKLPKGRWSPLRRSQHWKLPAIHMNSDNTAVDKPFINVASGSDLPGTSDKPLTYILQSAPPPFLMNGHLIEHVVCLMLENRGLDHFMGFLYEGSNKPKHSYPNPANAVGPHRGLRLYEGLEGMSPSCPYDYEYEIEEKRRIENPTEQDKRDPNNEKDKVGRWWRKVKVTHTIQGTAPMRRGAHASNIPTTNPHEDFVHIFQDMYGDAVKEIWEEHAHAEASVKDTKGIANKEIREKAVKNGKEYKRPPMDGWAQNFCDGIRHHWDAAGLKDKVISPDDVHEIMEMYLPDQLPVMHGLARHYAISDLWFCSVPSQTNTNRAFWCSGHAAGIVKNDFHPAFPGKEYASDKMPEGNDAKCRPFRRSLFDVLDEHGHDWRYHYTVAYPPVLRRRDGWGMSNYYYFMSMFPQFDKSPKVNGVDNFFKAAAAGTLPRVTYIEPFWGGGKIWDAISPSTRAVGNEFHPVQDMFCGEFYVKKVYEAIANSPAADTTVLVITFDENGGTYDHFAPWKAHPTDREPTTGKKTQYGFMFDCFGVRVPTLLISKYVKEGTVFRSPTEVPFDHTSVISTVLKWLGIDKEDWKLGDRVANAPTFDEVLQGTGEEEANRKKSATGLGDYDEARKSRIKGKTAIKYGQQVHLRYVGNRWADQPEDVGDYFHKDPDTGNDNYWYPKATKLKKDAMQLKFTGGSGAVKAGDKLVIEAFGKTTKGSSLDGRTFGVSSSGKGWMYLYKGGSPSKWLPWLVNDRVKGVELFAGDEIYLFSEAYEFDNLEKSYTSHPQSGVIIYDPFQKLTVDPEKTEAPHAARYAWWRAGRWDIWRLETE